MILVVAATEPEVKPILMGKSIKPGAVTAHPLANGVDADLLITGVGAVPTAFHLANAINKKRYSLVINVGIAGTYNPATPIGDVVAVEFDVFADYGIDDHGAFVSLHEAGLTPIHQQPFGENGWMQCPQADSMHSTHGLALVKGATVATASGSKVSIERIRRSYNPDIETMESAAVFYCCLMHNVQFLCLRGISNVVEPRDKSKWNLPLAIENLNRTLLKVTQPV